MEDSCFYARRTGAGVHATGRLDCSLGHRIAPGQGGQADGVHAFWNWDGGCLRAGNERYGLFPLFYYCGDGGFAISSSIPRLIAMGAPSELDEAALAVFLRLGFFIGEDTPYRHIRALPPGAALTWDGALHLQSSGRAGARACARLSRDEAIDTYVELFREAIARRPASGEGFVVPLSGGHDSRHILFELLSQGRRPQLCLTTEHYPPRSNEDARIAAALAADLDLPHLLLRQSESPFSAECRKNLKTGFCSDEHAWYMVAADYLARSGLAVYDGIGGDVLSAGLFVTPRRLALFTAGRTRAIAEELLAGEEAVLASLLPAALYRKLDRELAIARLEAELADHLERPNPIGSFFFWNRTRREIALVPYGLLGSLPEVFSPYLDHALFDFLSSLPVDLLADHAFHTDTIARAYPRYASFPYEDKEAPARDTLDGAAGFGRALALRLLSGGRSRLMRNGFLWPRLLACLLSRKRSAATHWFAAMALYLHQLESSPPAQ